MVRFIAVLLAVALVGACAYEKEVKRLSDQDVCSNLGQFTLYDQKDGIRITRDEISRRDIDKDQCSKIANDTIERLRPEYKLQLCQRLATYHYEGEYQAFRQTLDKVKSRGFNDQECMAMAEFRYQEIARDEERAERIRRAVQNAFGPGTAANPIHVDIQ